jgi:hypothetical protein
VIARKLLGAALVASVVTALAGCGTQFHEGETTQPRPTFEADAQLDAPVVDPTAIGIAKLGAWSTLVPLGLTDVDCAAAPPCLQPPPIDQPMQAGWYAGADPRVPDGNGDEIQPGEIGPAVIAGHVDGIVNGTKGHPGIFAELEKLTPGDKITIERNPQPPLEFVVTEVATYPKAQFPSERVYGRTDTPTLRLITCGGAFGNVRAGHYDSNVVVFAELEQ